MKQVKFIQQPEPGRKLMILRCFLGLLTVILLNACATRVTSIKKGTQHQLVQGKGFVLLGIETNRNLKMIKISGPQNIELSSTDIKEGSNYLLVDLEVGVYTIDKVVLDDYWRVELDDEYWQFEVKPDGISYVGHLDIARRGFLGLMISAELINRTSQALEFLENEYAELLSSHKVAYGGPGEDDFLLFLTEVKKELP